MYQRILIPTDSSPYSEAAIPHGVEMAQKLALPVVFLHLSPRITSAVPVSQEVFDAFEARLRQAGRDALEHARKLAQDAGVAVEVKLVEGSPASAIVAEARPDDLIVMGTYGSSSPATFVPGSLTMHVLHESPCPVLAVPTHHVPTSSYSGRAAPTVRRG